MEGADGTCYQLFYSSPKTWETSQAACLSLGGQLVVITDTAEQAIVGVLAGGVPANSPDSWIGATDAVAENSFVWVDGTNMGFNVWRSGEPNDGNAADRTENCTVIEGDNAAREWDDRTCLDVYPYICERAPNSQ